MVEGVPSLPPRPMTGPNPSKGDDADMDTDTYPHNISTAIVPFTQSTYVVQVPKDQIFRVPPPENARIVEEYRNKAKGNQSSAPYCNRFAIIIITLLAIALICLCGVIIFYFVANPSIPHVNVDHISVIKHVGTKPEFDIVMKAQNPSKAMDLRHNEGGKINLFYGGRQIASGDPHAFNIGHKDTAEVKLTLQGSTTTLPKVLNSTSKGTKDVFPLTLSADFPVKLGFGLFRIRKKELAVRCDLKISKVGKDMYVKSQNCKANF